MRDDCSGAELAERATCSVAVAFAPAAPGYRRAALRIDSTVSPGSRDAGAVTASTRCWMWRWRFAAVRAAAGRRRRRARRRVGQRSCDVDGDGYDDVLPGASQWSRIPATNSWEGAAYVTFGGPAFGGEDLAGVERSIRLEGSAEGSFAGTGVGCADVNGDGVDDVLVGAWAYEYPGRPAGTAASRGRAYVVFGGSALRSQPTIDLGALGAAGFVIVGPDSPEYDHLGYAVTRVGDLNGDGREDIAVMANTGDTTGPRTNNGIVWVVPGQTGVASVDVSRAGAVLARIDGASPGSSVAPFGQMIGLDGVGDVNGDGVPDIGIGTYTAMAFGRTTASGAAFAISGTNRGQVDLASSSSYLFAVGGAFAGHRLGIAIDGAGDVNGDGLADLVIGADSTAAANSDAAYVVYGSPARARRNAARQRGAGRRWLPDPRWRRRVDRLRRGRDRRRERRRPRRRRGRRLCRRPRRRSGAGSGWIVSGVADPSVARRSTRASSRPTPADTTRTIVLASLGARGSTGRPAASASAAPSPPSGTSTAMARPTSRSARTSRSVTAAPRPARSQSRCCPARRRRPSRRPRRKPRLSRRRRRSPPVRRHRSRHRSRTPHVRRWRRAPARRQPRPRRVRRALHAGRGALPRHARAPVRRPHGRVGAVRHRRQPDRPAHAPARACATAPSCACTAVSTVTADGHSGTVRRTLKVTIRNRHT